MKKLLLLLVIILLATFGYSYFNNNSKDKVSQDLETGDNNVVFTDDNQDDFLQEDSITLISNNSSLSTLTTAIKAAGQFVRGTGPFTTFAPTNAAFDKLPDGELERLLKPENQEELQSLLQNHLVANEFLVADLEDGETLNTIANDTLDINKSNGKVTINNTSTLIQTDLKASNGVIHTIDTIITD